MGAEGRGNAVHSCRQGWELYQTLTMGWGVNPIGKMAQPR